MSKRETGGEDYQQLRERLRSKSLTDDDVRRLEELISGLEGGEGDRGTLGTLGGRPIVARLPGGLDVVK